MIPEVVGLSVFAGFFVVVDVAGTGMSRFWPPVVFAGLGAGVDLPGLVGAGFSGWSIDGDGVEEGLRPILRGVGEGVGSGAGVGVGVGFFLRVPKRRWKKLSFLGFGVG